MVTLDKQATIDYGNALRRGEAFEELYQRSKQLIDSTRLLFERERNINKELMTVTIPAYKDVARSAERETATWKEIHDVQKRLSDSYHRQSKERFWHGFKTGGIIASLIGILIAVL